MLVLKASRVCREVEEIAQHVHLIQTKSLERTSRRNYNFPTSLETWLWGKISKIYLNMVQWMQKHFWTHHRISQRYLISSYVSGGGLSASAVFPAVNTLVFIFGLFQLTSRAIFSSRFPLIQTQLRGACCVSTTDKRLARRLIAYRALSVDRMAITRSTQKEFDPNNTTACHHHCHTKCVHPKKKICWKVLTMRPSEM